MKKLLIFLTTASIMASSLVFIQNNIKSDKNIVVAAPTIEHNISNDNVNKKKKDKAHKKNKEKKHKDNDSKKDYYYDAGQRAGRDSNGEYMVQYGFRGPRGVKLYFFDE